MVLEHKHTLDGLEGPLYQDVAEGEPYTGQLATWIQRCTKCEYTEVVAQGRERHMLERIGTGAFRVKHGAFAFPVPS